MLENRVISRGVAEQDEAESDLDQFHPGKPSCISVFSHNTGQKVNFLEFGVCVVLLGCDCESSPESGYSRLDQETHSSDKEKLQFTDYSG